jgi:hypothetical protein
MKVVRLSALRTGRLYHPGNIPGTHFCWRLSRPQGHSAAGRIMSMKHANDTIGNRTRGLPTYSAVPPPGAQSSRKNNDKIWYCLLHWRQNWKFRESLRPDPQDLESCRWPLNPSSTEVKTSRATIVLPSATSCHKARHLNLTFHKRKEIKPCFGSRRIVWPRKTRKTLFVAYCLRGSKMSTHFVIAVIHSPSACRCGETTGKLKVKKNTCGEQT